MFKITVQRPPVRLPDIPLSRLPERTKDFIIAASCTGKPVTDVVVDALSSAAVKAGFIPERGAEP